MKMHNARYLSLRKQNVLSSMNLYIIFILFISNLNSFYCAEQLNHIEDGVKEKVDDNLCMVSMEGGECVDINNGKDNNIVKITAEKIPIMIASDNIVASNYINKEAFENKTILMNSIVINENEDKTEAKSENVINEDEGKTEAKSENIVYENEIKTEIKSEYIINTNEIKTQAGNQDFISEYEIITEQLYNQEESFNNTEHIYNTIKNDLILNFNKTENNYLKIETNNNYSFQITTVNNQIDSLLNNIKSEFSVIDLKECTKKLNKEIGREEDADLIILKYENENQVDVNKKSIQYEIYNPENNNKLDLSVCSDTKIDIYIPVQLSEETQQLFEDLKSQGYNLFDKNDKFYTDICTPYKSKDGTDILLSDRLNEFFVNNELSCQANCEYSDYLPGSEYLKCECNVVNKEKIETKEPEKLTAKSTLKSFYNILKYSNYKVLKCYKLVFRKFNLFGNKGSALSLIYFLGFFLGIIIFCFRKFIYINEEVNKLFLKGKNEKNEKKFQKKINKESPVIFNNKDLNKKNTKKILVSLKEYNKKDVKKNAIKRKIDLNQNLIISNLKRIKTKNRVNQ